MAAALLDRPSSEGLSLQGITAPNIGVHQAEREAASIARCRLSALASAVPNLGKLLVAQGLPLVVQGVISLFAAAALGPAGKGEATLALTIISLGGAVLFLSMHVGLVNVYRGGGSRALARALSFVLVLSLLPLSLGVATGAARLGGASSTRQTIVFLALALIPVEVPFLVLSRTVQGLGDALAYTSGVLVRLGVYACGVSLMAVTTLTPAKMVAAYAISDAAGLLFVGIALSLLLSGRRPRILKRPGGAVGPRTSLRLIRPSLEAHVAVLSQQASYRTDAVLLGFLAPAAALGQYSVATALAEILWVVAEAISLAVFASAARDAAEGNEPAIAATLQRAVRLQGMVAVVGCLTVAPAAAIVLHFLLPAYQPALVLVLILLPGVAIGGIARIVASAAIAAQRAGIVRGFAIVSASLVMLYPPFIVVGSAMGAAIASSIIYTLTTLSYVGLARRILWP